MRCGSEEAITWDQAEHVARGLEDVVPVRFSLPNDILECGRSAPPS